MRSMSKSKERELKNALSKISSKKLVFGDGGGGGGVYSAEQFSAAYNTIIG